MREARYLYCVARSRLKINFGKIGIDDSEVYTVNCKDLCALVHDCPSKSYRSKDGKKVKSWIARHEKVVETAWARFGTVLPFSFDTIIRSDQYGNAERNIKKWLDDEDVILKQKLDKIRDKAEFGVQIYWNSKTVRKNLADTSGGTKYLNKGIHSKSKGSASLHGQKLDNLLKKQMEVKAERYSKYFYERIKKFVDEIKIKKTRRSEDGKQMLLSLSCLLPKEKSKALSGELKKINKREGFFVRFTGPWPPYSFV